MESRSRSVLGRPVKPGDDELGRLTEGIRTSRKPPSKANHDLPGAERELRATLAEEFAMKEVLAPSFTRYVKSALALVLSDEHRFDDARQAAAAGCESRSSPLLGKLQAAGLCTSPPQ
jgi:hypothetical protein